MIPLGALSAVLQVIAAFFITMMISLSLFLSILTRLDLAECIFERADMVRAYTVKSNSVDDGIPDNVQGDERGMPEVRHAN